jgi:glycine/D-amino acid oxidase-like deaminating enzyme
MNNIPVWDDGRWAGFSPLAGSVKADVCVIGLGGSGLAAVKAFLAQGMSVVGLDAGAIAGGAAGRNGGFLLAGPAAFHHEAQAAHGRAIANRLYALTLQELDRMTAETPEAIRRTGSLRIAADETEWADCRRQHAAMQADGWPVDFYEGTEGRGLCIPTDGVFNPLVRCRQLALQAVDAGAVLYEHSRALEISAGMVKTGAGRVQCEKVLVAVDGRLEKILPEQVRSTRLQMLATEPLPTIRFTRPVYRRWGYDYWQQLPDRRIALGGLRDAHLEREWTDHAEPSDALQAGLTALAEQIAGYPVGITHRWAAIVGYTPNGLPIVTEVRPGVWAIGGYNGTGNIVGAICGRGIAEKIATGASPLLDWVPG